VIYIYIFYGEKVTQLLTLNNNNNNNNNNNKAKGKVNLSL